MLNLELNSSPKFIVCMINWTKKAKADLWQLYRL